MRIPLLAAALIAVASTAEADIITINASDFAIGTNITQAVIDVRLQTLVGRGNPIGVTIGSRDVFASTAFYGTPADVAFGGTSGSRPYEACRQGSSTACDDFQSAFEVAFLTPTDYIAVEAINGPDYSVMEVYSITGEHLQQCGSWSGGTRPGCYSLTTTRPNQSHDVTLSFQSDTRNIGRVVFGGDDGVSNPTSISYGVPEPTSLAALLLGLSGWSASRLRSRKAAPQS